MKLMETDEPKPSGTIWLFVILILASFAAAVMYFGRGSKDLTITVQSSIHRPTPTRQPRLYTVYYSLGVFSPTNIRIHVGDSVKFRNDSNFPIRIVPDHSGGVQELAGLDSVNDISSNGFFTFTFTESGTFGYCNGKNPTEKGTIIVRPQ
jgi:hypothetical protein